VELNSQNARCCHLRNKGKIVDLEAPVDVSKENEGMWKRLRDTLHKKEIQVAGSNEKSSVGDRDLGSEEKCGG
jgi:hypothetical protein